MDTLKRVFDLLMSILLLVLLFPLMLALAALTWVKLGRPVLFKQARPGLQGKPFYLYKFRTMSELRSSDGRLLPDQMRLTRFGKFLRRFSLDEFPQLYNVIKGDLSLVGPRPLLMEYLSYYDSEQARRHEVKPGITGWAQINGRNAITWEGRFQLDVWYVDNRSFGLDLKILLISVLKVLKGQGVSWEGWATMPRFTGNRKPDNLRTTDT